MGVCEGREVVGCRGSEDMGVDMGVGVGVGDDRSTAGSAETAGVDS